MHTLPHAKGPFGETGVRATPRPRRPVLMCVGLLLLAVDFLLLQNWLGARGPSTGDAAPATLADASAGKPVAPMAGPAADIDPAPRRRHAALLVTPPALGDRTPHLSASDAEPARPGVPDPLDEAAHEAAPTLPAAPPADEIAEAEAREATLRLTRRERRAIQRRLALLGHDPKGIDGVFGPGTRTAIQTWQAGLETDTGEAVSPTGYLDAASHARLLAQSEPRYRAWRRDVAERERQRETREIAAVAAELFSQPYPVQRCARRLDGSVIGHQGLICDLRGIGEGMVGLVRSLGTM